MNEPRNRRVLLIDDMPSIHEDFRKILRRQPSTRDLDDAEVALFGRAAAPGTDGFEMDSAYQGREGLEKVEAAVQAGRPYAMAFVDMRMPPGWDGVETIERLWQADPQLQVVICTAYSDHPWEEVLARLDVQDRLLVLKKPFDMIEVSQLAATLAAKWQLTRQAALQMRSLEQTVKELKATAADLRRSNKDLEGFAHSISHDLRSPLIAMGAFSNLLARELEGHASGNVRHYLARIRASATRSEQLIEGLLVLSQVARAQLQVEPLDLSAMAHELLDECRRAAPQRAASIAVQDGIRVAGDRRLIRTAMRNLLDNAWKFTSGREHAAIEVGRYEDEGGQPVFFVRDNGDGFDMAYAGKLFHSVQRLHAHGAFPGSGVGLVTVGRIIDRHGGRIWAHSSPGEGATLSFVLP